MREQKFEHMDERTERQAHLLAWVRALPSDVDEKPAGMVKLIRHLISDMDYIATALERERMGE